MKTHFCTKKQSLIDFSNTCNLCGEKEPDVLVLFEDQPQFYTHVHVISDRLAWVTWALVAIVSFSLMLGTAYVIGKIL